MRGFSHKIVFFIGACLRTPLHFQGVLMFISQKLSENLLAIDALLPVSETGITSD